jgi:peptidoglycan/LPS O-acetylase OafA/YrhL
MRTSRPTGATPKDLVGLELLRFLCAATILFWHYQHFFILPSGTFLPGFQAERQPFYLPLIVAYNWGNYAVDVFWALSGFIFFWKYAQPIRDGHTTARRFFVLRFSRLYPLHALTLVLVLALQSVFIDRHGVPFIFLFNDLRHFVLQLFFASDWGFDKGLSFNGPIWSISAEVLAYAVFFAVARRIRFTGRTMTAIILGLIVAKMVLPWVKDLVLCQLFFFVGGAVHLLVSRPGARPLRATAIAAAVAALLLGVNTVTAGKVHTFAVIAVAVALLFAFTALGNALRRAGAGRLCTRLGDLTYSSYLLHFPLQLAIVLVIDQLGVDRGVFYGPAPLAAFVLGTFALAAASYALLERPAQLWIRGRFGGEAPRHAATLAADQTAAQ